MTLKPCSRTTTYLVLILVTVSTAQTTGSAVERFQSFQAELRASHKANDWPSNLLSAGKLKEFLNEAPGSLLEVVRADIHAGNLNAAFREMEQFVRMGQSTDLLKMSQDFAALVTDVNFTKIQSGMAANRVAISVGSTAFQLTDPGLLAEDVDYDPRAKRFFITSVRENKIISTTPGGASTDFAKTPDNWPMMGVKVDSARGVLWATAVAIQDFSSVPEADWGKSAVLCYDLKTGKVLRRVDAPRPSALGDMVLTEEGDVIVSDGEGGGCIACSPRGPSWNASTTEISFLRKLRRCIQMANISSCLTMFVGLVYWRLRRRKCGGFPWRPNLRSTALRAVF